MSSTSVEEQAVRLARCAVAAALPGDVPDRFLFLTISGAHLYGFASPDSDLDLRGSHVVDLDAVIGLQPYSETYEHLGGMFEGIELDCVSHDVSKYLRLLTKKNGYVLEQIFSPLVVLDSGELAELRALAREATTRHVVHHYRGFFRNQMEMAKKEEKPKAKTLLYLFRVVMTGIHLLRTGEVQANLPILNDEIFRRGFVDELIERKRTGTEKGTIPPEERDELLVQAESLAAELEEAFQESTLPDDVPNTNALHDFLVRVRRSTDRG